MDESCVALVPLSPPVRRLGPGRPTTYSPDIGNRILAAVTGGMLLSDVARQDWAPEYVTMWRWGRAFPDFGNALADARKGSAHLLAESCLALTDEVDATGERGVGAAAVSKVREQVGVRRWLAGVLDRETYGDRTQLDIRSESVSLVAFVDLTSKPSGPDLDDDSPPPVLAPDVPTST